MWITWWKRGGNDVDKWWKTNATIRGLYMLSSF